MTRFLVHFSAILPLYVVITFLPVEVLGWTPRDGRKLLSLEATSNRRAFVTKAAVTAATLLVPTVSTFMSPALAQREEDFVNVGKQAPPPTDETMPFKTLDNGVKIKDFRVGTGADAVRDGSRVSIQCSGRLLNLNGVPFYNTKNNNPDDFGALPLVFTVGKGEAVPGLESGILGMKKGGIRRIIVPEDLAYSMHPDLEPKPMNTTGQRALDSVIKNPRRDATILFDVQVERFK